LTSKSEAIREDDILYTPTGALIGHVVKIIEKDKTRYFWIRLMNPEEIYA
jgi:hypothetical protein